MVSGWRAMDPRPVYGETYGRNANEGITELAGGDNFSKVEKFAKTLVKAPAVQTRVTF